MLELDLFTIGTVVSASAGAAGALLAILSRRDRAADKPNPALSLAFSDGRLKTGTPHAQALLGLIGIDDPMPSWDKFASALEPLFPELASVRTTGLRGSGTRRIPTRDPGDLTLSVRHGPDGFVVAFEATEPAALTALRLSAEHRRATGFAALLDKIPVGVWQLGADGEVLFANTTYRNMQTAAGPALDAVTEDRPASGTLARRVRIPADN
jgi:PAS domain-containing protein